MNRGYVNAFDLKAFKISFDKITKEEYLDQGAQGAVFRARFENHIVAVKELYGPGHYDESRLRRMLQMKHENLISILAFCERPYCLVMPLCAGSLGGVIKHANDIDHNVFYLYATQIAFGMQYLHKSGVVHRDLKPDNILLTNDGNLKISDFDLSKEIDNIWMSMSSCCGTPLWMAPEILFKKTYTKAVDVWSYAIVVWQMIMQRMPYESLFDLMSPPELMQRLYDNKIRLPIPSGCSYFLRQILMSCIVLDPTERPSFNYIVNVLKHVKINENVWKNMKPKWRSMKLDYNYSPATTVLYNKSLIRWQNFTAVILHDLENFLSTSEYDGKDLRTVEILLNGYFTVRQKRLLEYIVSHEVAHETEKPNILNLNQLCTERIEKLKTLKNEIISSTKYCQEYTAMVLLSLKSTDKSMRIEGVKRFFYLAHTDQHEKLQEEALPLILKSMKSKTVNLVRAGCEILVVERMTKKLKLNEKPKHVKILISALQRHSSDKTVARLLLHIFNTMEKQRDMSLMKPIMQLLHRYGGLTVEGDIWITRCCWEILAGMVQNRIFCANFLRNNGAQLILQYARNFTNDCFIQHSIFRLTHNCHLIEPSTNHDFMTILCDYIDQTKYHAIFSLDAIGTLDRLLQESSNEGKSRSKEELVEKGLNTIMSWEFGDMEIVYTKTRGMFEKRSKESVISQLLYVVVCADMAMTDSISGRLMTANECEAILEPHLKSEKLDENVKILVEISLDKWKKV